MNKWFNTAAFQVPAPFTFGNESRTDSSLRDQGVANWDFTLGKTIPITERVNFQFKTEVFNLFNRVQFADPGTSGGRYRNLRHWCQFRARQSTADSVQRQNSVSE